MIPGRRQSSAESSSLYFCSFFTSFLLYLIRWRLTDLKVLVHEINQNSEKAFHCNQNKKIINNIFIVLMNNPWKALYFVENICEAKLIMLRIDFSSIGSKKQRVRKLKQYLRINQDTEIVRLKTRTGKMF